MESKFNETLVEYEYKTNMGATEFMRIIHNLSGLNVGLLKTPPQRGKIRKRQNSANIKDALMEKIQNSKSRFNNEQAMHIIGIPTYFFSTIFALILGIHWSLFVLLCVVCDVVYCWIFTISYKWYIKTNGLENIERFNILIVLAQLLLWGSVFYIT